jgi:CelD/BcsL family acetyltransferase involved in cellulose biosynthesis
MELTLHTVFPEDLHDEWNALLEESTAHVPFLRHEYLRIWWQTRGGGEWPQAELAIVTARQQGRLVGIAPLFVATPPRGQPALLLLGSIEISDYLDLIARPADLEPFLAELLPFLQQAQLPAWHRLDLYNVLESSPTLPALERAARQQGWGFDLQRLQRSPYITLPGDWEAYLAGIDKKQRHEVRRKMRRATELNPPARWYLTSDPQRLEEDISAFLELMRHEEDKAAFLTEAMQTHMRLTIRCAFENGCLNLAFLEVDGQKACGYLSFDYLNRIWVYNSGMDPRYKDYSPGWVLLGHLLQWANENGREMLDFMRGNEEYKYRFGATDRFVMRATLHP